MKVQCTFTGMMELENAGKEGSGAHVLNVLGGSVYLAKDAIQGPFTVGPVKEAVILGEFRKADYGFNVQPSKVTLKQ